MQPLFLTLAEVIDIHKDQIEQYGGGSGIRDLGFLQSALAQPESSFSGEWLHLDLYEMAAAYAYHICNNHPFIDGNKRTALAASLVFLELNGISILDPKHKLLDVMWQTAKGKLDKDELAKILRKLSK